MSTNGDQSYAAVSPEQGGSSAEELAYRLRQQELLAGFGLFALEKRHNLDAILHEACRLCAEGLQTDLCKVAEWKTESRLLVRAGVGWKAGAVGRSMLGADLESPAGYALLTGAPVISNHLANETRFRTPELLAKHGVRRAINVVIGGVDRPYGVLEADSRDSGRFTEHDIAFMQSVAGLLGIAINDHDNASRLRQSERAFRVTFEQAAVGIAHVALDGSWLRVNQRLCEITGYSHGEMLELTFQDITHPDDLSADLAQKEALIAGAIETYTMEKRYLRKDGASIWIDLTVSLARGDDCEPLHLISVVQDIDARKRVEAKLNELTGELEKRVLERTSDLEAVNLRLRTEMIDRLKAEAALLHASKLKAVGELAGGIAHDFNNVLAIIGGNLELASTDVTGRAADRIDLARRGVERGAKLSRNLLDFSRQNPLNPTLLDLGTRTRAIRDMLDRTLGALFGVESDLAPDLWPVRVDADQLDLAILNAAVNARDAMPHGGIFRIAGRNVTDAEDRRWVEIILSDTGDGVPPEVAERVFEPFFTTKPCGNGSGLGLAQIHGFATQAGGTARIESEPGKGTALVLRLPAGDPA